MATKRTRNVTTVRANSRRNRGSKWKSILLVILFVLLVIVVVAILFSLDILILPSSPGEEKLFPVQDKCTMIAGKLIKSIVDEDACRLRCVGECEVRDKNFVNSTFIEYEKDCNSCVCSCR